LKDGYFLPKPSMQSRPFTAANRKFISAILTHSRSHQDCQQKSGY